MVKKRKTFSKGASSAIIIVVILVLVGAVFLLSPQIFSGGGLIGGGVGSGTQGLVITRFLPDQVAVEGSQRVIFDLEVENKGSRIARSTSAEIFGLTGWTGTMKKDLGEIAGGDPTTGQKGDVSVESFTLDAPAARTNDVPYTASVRVTYNYDTVTDVSLRVATVDYVRATNTQVGIIDPKTTSGPFQVQVTTPRTPTISPGVTTARIQFTIQNIGGGGAYKTTPGDRTITASVSGAKSCTDSGDMTLTQQGTKTITCDIDVSSVTDVAQFSITLTLTYKYYVDSSTTVTVLKSLSEISGGTVTQPSGGASAGQSCSDTQPCTEPLTCVDGICGASSED